MGVGVKGLVVGGLSALTAMGLVLIYRAVRIVNFSQVGIGGLAASVALVMVTGWHLPYFAGIAVGFVAAILTGAVMEMVVIRRFANAPRLVLTVATIGLVQVLGAAEIELPHLFTTLSSSSSFTVPFHLTFGLGPATFTGNDVLAMAVIPAAMVALWWFLSRTDTGVAIRAAADSRERAGLLGIPVKRLSLIVWMVAAGLSGVGAILAVQINGSTLGTATSPVDLLAPLAAAVIGGMDSLPVTFVAALVIGVINEAVFWSYPQSPVVDVVFFVLILVALLVQPMIRRRLGTAVSEDLERVVVKEPKPIPVMLARLREVKISRWALLGVVLAAAVLVPVTLSDPRITALSRVAIFAIVAVSMVVLMGWSGQLSLGQFAFVGVGASITGALIVHAHLDLFVAMAVAAVAGALVALAIGLPALRIPGLLLAVTTMAFAVPVSTFLLSSQRFPLLNPTRVLRPTLFGRFDLNDSLTFYYVCLLVLVVTLIIARNFRRSRSGRAVVAARDNPRAAAAYAISPLRARLIAFALAGALAGIAGGLYEVSLGGIGFSGLSPETSFTVLTMVVIGGLGSLLGAVLGAAYVEWALYSLNGAWQLLATGVGVLVLLMFLPEGLGGVSYRLRDLGLRTIARMRGIPWEQAVEGDASSKPEPAANAGAPGGAEANRGAEDGIAAEGTEAAAGAAGGGHAVPVDAGALLIEEIEAAGVGGPGAGGGDVTPAGADVLVPVVGEEPTVQRPVLLSCAGLDAAYGHFQVLFGTDLEVGEGEVLSVLGTNGAGKTTLLRVISGVLRPASGHLTYAGVDIAHWSMRRRVSEGLVLMPAGKGVFPTLTVAENFRVGAWMAQRSDPAFVTQAARKLLELFPPLAARLDTKAGMLSGGEQQMLGLALALLCRPRLLMVDELSLGLAPAVVTRLMEVIRSLAGKGVTTIVVEQSVNVATAVSNRAVFIERGRVSFSGHTPELARQPELLRSRLLRVAERPGAGAVPSPSGNGGQPVSAANHSEARPASTDASPHATTAGERNALEVTGITKLYGGVAALGGVDIAVRSGEILGIIGANGAGKTTLFDVCSGFLRPDKGSVKLHGLDVTAMGPYRRSKLGLGRVFQNAQLFGSMTVPEAIAVSLERRVEVKDPLAGMLGLAAAKESERKILERVEELMETMGLGRWRSSFVSELSTGTRRVVELTCALAHEPDVLLLDEPSAGIAQRESEALAEMLVNLRSQTGATFLLIEHDVPLVSSVADRMICMHLGKVIAEGSVRDVLDDPSVISSYLGAPDAAGV